MKILAVSLGGLLALAACTPAVDTQVIDQMEEAVREGLAAQGTVKQVELTRESDDRMTGFAIVEPRDAPGTEARFTCTAEREGETGSQFNWRCTPPGGGSETGSEAQPAGGKDPQAAGAGAGGGAAAGPGRTTLVGRWTDTGDCSVVTLLGEDGVFIAPDGGRGNWTLEGSTLTLSGPGGSISWEVFLDDPNTMTLTSADGSTAQSTRC